MTQLTNEKLNFCEAYQEKHNYYLLYRQPPIEPGVHSNKEGT